ncbi:PREDICTED: apoptosis-inducing factor 1, mitochondrial isoform X2 [Dinoponera quadriceps]|uniref:Apoptosis-inducing factor 1, mitochondrial isoform X2 n=1 Tax=Dinoponera quadriceps TaxID=609295 RepID=A0A6P3Y1K5_DINQU|nr:PREDICTED: apoptosis-inducing factor 1, mitochondrial isoform X2 [Dinoponera quadriceps]
MIVCGRVIGRLSSRLTHATRLYQPVNYAGTVNISNLHYSSDASNKKTPGTTIKPEECVPKYCKTEQGIPACALPNGSCPPPFDKEQKQSGDKGGKKYQFQYWHLLTALVVTGIAGYTLFLTVSKGDGTVSEKKDKRKLRRFRQKTKIPTESQSLPPEIPYLLIGGGTAAFSAFRSIKSRDPKATVLVITEEEEFPYMRPPLSKELWYNTDRESSQQLRFKQWNGTQRSIFYEPGEFYLNIDDLIKSEKGGVAVATGWKVTKLDVLNKKAILEDGYEIKYDKCLIATGSTPKNLSVFESAEDNVKDKITTYRTKEDFLDLEESVADSKCKNIAVIGGGFLGSELACVLARNYKSKNVYQIFREKFIMDQVLPEYLSEWTTNKAKAEGVKVVPSKEVEDFRYKDSQLSLVLTGGETMNVDRVIVAVGAEPNTDLAKTSRLETDPQIGGFLVNAELEARSNIWVAGDAACFYDIVLGRRRVQHHDHAVISGRLAGENMTGAGKPYLHQAMFWSDLGPDVGYEAVGIVDSSLPTVAVFAKASAKEGNAESTANPNEKHKSNPEEKQSDIKSEEASQIVKNIDYTNSEKKETSEHNTKSEEESKKDFNKGVIFYLKDDIVVGIVLWNIFNRIRIAKQVLAKGTKYDDLNEVAKVFTIHDD